MPFLKHRRQTPWDAERRIPFGWGLFGARQRDVPPARARLRAGWQEVWYLHGLDVFDPTLVTSEDFRQFMWTGLRCLRAQAKERGLSDEHVRQLLVSAFEVFHDAADSMWTTLKATAPPTVLDPVAEPAPCFDPVPRTTVQTPEQAEGLQGETASVTPRSRNITVAYEEVVLTEEDAEILRRMAEDSTFLGGRPTRNPRRMPDG
jgi:hypothetical protein